ncbi:hypothetical protein H4R19_004004 [Coemansia spiralis]|nr:hypothetical protein H4R19_004004 [Coemansia spiralis]
MADVGAGPRRARSGAPNRKLRRTQSATASGAGDLPGSLDSESDCDLPDACSLLKTPVPKASSRARTRKRPLTLAKSASDVAPLALSTRAADSDGDGSGSALRIPGELVLAYALRKYYPGRVLSQSAPNRFAVEFFDGSRSTLSRARILTMYEARFYTCPLGGFKLVGDQPAASAQHGSIEAPDSTADPERDFERDQALFHRLVCDVESIRASLDALHECPADKIDALRETEDRMAAFFGSDAGAKRRLVSRVAKGHLNRAEFDFLGRLLCRWYAVPPRALIQPETSADVKPAADGDSPADEAAPANDAEAGSNAECAAGGAPADNIEHATADSAPSPSSDTSQLTEPVASPRPADPKLGAQTVEFVHEVLLPHAIKRLTMAREQCTLAESELHMIRSDSDIGWVDQILAARQCL